MTTLNLPCHLFRHPIVCIMKNRKRSGSLLEERDRRERRVKGESEGREKREEGKDKRRGTNKEKEKNLQSPPGNLPLLMAPTRSQHAGRYLVCLTLGQCHCVNLLVSHLISFALRCVVKKAFSRLRFLLGYLRLFVSSFLFS